MCFRLWLDFADLRFPPITGEGAAEAGAAEAGGAEAGATEAGARAGSAGVAPGVDAKFPLALTVAYVNPPAVIAIIPYINTGNP